MKILDRYILREFLSHFIFILLAILSIYLLIDFFSKLRMFMSNNATPGQMARHFFFFIPMIVSQTTPAVILLATLMSFGTLSKHSEITAIKANGISVFRFARPVLLLSVGLAVGLFLFSELVTPASFHKAEYVRLVEVQKQQALGTFKQNQIWFRGKEGIFNVQFFDLKTSTLYGITLNELDSAFRLTRRIDAEKAEWQGKGWLFSNVLITTFPEGGGFPILNRQAKAVIPLVETPADFTTVQKDADKMGFFELWSYTRKLEADGYDATRYQADLHGKVAMSVVCILLPIIGLSFSLRSERSGGAAQSIGVGVIIGFSYWLLFAFSLSLGRSGTVPPFLAAWFANIVFAAGAWWLSRRVSL